MFDRLRPLFAAVALSAAAVTFPLWIRGDNAPVAVMMGLLLISALLCFHRHVASQLIVRATLWAHLLFAAGASLYGSGDERGAAALCTLSLALGFAVLGARGLSAADKAGAFQPVAFRTSMLLGAAISLAQAEWFSFFTAALLDDGEVHFVWFAVAVAAIGLALVGLYRLQLWGLLLKTVLDLGFFGLAAALVADRFHPITFGMLVMGTLQVGLTVPIWVAVVRHKKPEGQGSPALVQVLLSVGALVAAGIAVFSNVDEITRLLAA